MPPLRVAIVTPYFDKPLHMLQEAHASVLAQTYPCRHFLVSDGRPEREIESWDADHIVLSRTHGDYGSTPTFVGTAAAAMQGFDLVTRLDSDNWYRDDHIQTLVDLHARSGAAFLSTGRMLCRLDGSVMSPCPLTDPERFIDANCMAFAREALPLLAYYVSMPDYAHAISDRPLYQHIRASGIACAHSNERTVFYRCGKTGAYQMLGEPIPPGVAAPPDYDAIFARWEREGHPPLI